MIIYNYIYMSDTEDTIVSRIKKRVECAARKGRVGGTEHKKRIEERKKEMEKRKKQKKMKIEC
jgi:hypothetical protein